MQQKDKTGPEGRGPMTGRGQGFCIDFEIPEIEISEFGSGFGRGFGRGSGRGQRFQFRIQPKQYTKEEQIELLKDQKEVFEGRVLAIGKQLKEIKKSLEKKKVRGNK